MLSIRAMRCGTRPLALLSRAEMPFQTQCRGLIQIGNSSESPSDSLRQLKTFARDSESMACNQYPGYKVTHFKNTHWKAYTTNMRMKRKASHKVLALIEFIDFKREHKFK